MSAATSVEVTRRRPLLAWAGLFARLIVGGVMFVAGALKVGDPQAAGAAVQAYRLMPPDLARTIGYALPALEILLGLLLIVGLFTRIAAIVSGLLLIAFMVGIVSVWVRGYSIDCGCFGGGGDVSAEGRAGRYTTELIRDAALVAMSALLVLHPRTVLSADAWLSSAPLPYDDVHDDDVHDDSEVRQYEDAHGDEREDG